jgi:uncharacterized protein YecT (DUF1311 family)
MDNDALSDNIHPNSPSYVIVITAFTGLIGATAALFQALPSIKEVFAPGPRTQLQSNADSTKSGNASRSSREQLSPPAVSYCNSEEEWGRMMRSNDSDSFLVYIRQCRPNGKFLSAAERELESRLFTRASECIQSASSCNPNSCIDIYLRPLPNGQRAQALNALAARFLETNPRCAASPPPETSFCSGPSFDCNRAANTIERLICQDAELACLDSNLARAFNGRLESLAPSGRRNLRQEERDWLSLRDSQCDLPSPAESKACAKAFYKRRIAQIQN